MSRNLVVYFFLSLELMLCVPAFAQERKVTVPLTDQTSLIRHRVSQNWCVNCEQGLADARAALAAAGSTAVNVVIHGDSITAGADGSTVNTNGYAYQIERELKRRFGKGNSESIWLYNNLDGTNGRWQRVVDGPDAWNPSGSILNFGGIRGYAWTDTGTSANLRVQNLYGTGIEIYYVRNPNTTAQWSYKVDSGSSVNVSQSATASLATAVVERVQITGLSLANHQIDIFGPASGKVSITGVSATMGTTGVRFHNWSQSAYTTNQWLGQPGGEPDDNRALGFAAVQPKLLILALGVNDAGGTPNLATYTANLQKAITAQTYGSVLLLWTSPTPSGASEAARQQYVDAMLGLVHANPTKVAFINGKDFFGGLIATMSARGYTSDSLHPNGAGHRALAQLVLSALAPSADTGAVGAKNGGTSVGPRARFNFIEGSNITLTVADDATNDEVDATIAVSGNLSGITNLTAGGTVSGSSLNANSFFLNSLSAMSFSGSDMRVGTGYTTLGLYAGTSNALRLAFDASGNAAISNNLAVAGTFTMSGTPQTLTGAGAVNLTTYSTLLVTTGANALTLAAGSEGQTKFIRMKTDGGDGTLTVTNLQGGTTITFNDAGDFVYLFYQDGKWHILTNSGCVVA